METSARRQRADELGGLDHCPPQAVIGVVDFGGTISYGGGANPAGEANCLCAKISYGSALFRVGCRCGLLVLLLEIPTAANCRFAKISYGAVASRPVHFGLQGLFLGLELLGGILRQEGFPLPTIAYVDGEYRVRVANFQCIKTFYGAGASRLASDHLLGLGLENPGELLGWEDPASVKSTMMAQNVSLQGLQGL